MAGCRWLLAMALVMAAPLADAQPDPRIRVGHTVADEVTAGYRFERFTVASAEGTRRYRVHLAVPTAAPPRQGFPVAYLLDGNAALMELDAGLLKQLATRPRPPVLALIAHDNDLRIDGDARTFDYTPRRSAGEGDEFDVMNTARRSGGADAFLQLVQTRIKPQVAERAKVDASRQLLWGHSYGGLFALHVLATRPQAFTTYAAVDPSLWWGDGFIVAELEKAVGPPPKASRTLLLIRGAPGVGASPAREGPHAARGRGNDAAGQRLSAALAKRNELQVQRIELPGVSHGQTLGAGIAPALKLLAD